MNEDEAWESAKRPVTEFVDSIKDMHSNIDKLIEFYTKHSCPLSAGPQLGGQKQLSSTNDDVKDETGSRQTLSPLSCAKLEIAMVFAMNTCYWLHLVTNGEDPTKDKISKDFERTRLFINRAKEVDDAMRDNNSSIKRVKMEYQPISDSIAK